MRRSRNRHLRIENRDQVSGVKDHRTADSKKPGVDGRDERAARFGTCEPGELSTVTDHCIISIVPADVSIRVLFKPCAVRPRVPVEKREVCQKSQARYCV